uniref:Uncharacterized protein n=1 Tax=Trichogramma kaykai TaxID=54128 RepID=A0ABD2XKG8_9HYME
MHVACTASNCWDIVEKYLELGQDPNLVVEKTGDSPLHFAARGLNAFGIELLLRRGADLNLANKDGSTPLHTMVNSYNNAYYSMKVFFEINDYLGQTVQINARDKLGNTPLHLTITCVRRTGIMYAIELLLRRGIDPTLANAAGSTTLHLICQRGHDYDMYPSNRYCEDDIVERYFEMVDDQNHTLQVDARNGLGRTPLQLAVASLEPKAVDVLFDRGADLSNFVFPDESYFGEKVKARHYEFWFKFRRASSALSVVERLENRGYELDRCDALTIMKLFAEHELFEKSEDLEERWYDDQEFVRNARGIMIKPNLSFYDLVQLRFKVAAKQFTFTDYYNIWYAEQFWKRPHNEDCDSYLCEKLSRRFFQQCALEPFMELIHCRLPILCCDLIIEQLKNKDLYNICLAAADQSHDVSN